MGGGLQANAADLTVIILTFNEEKHLARCLDSVRKIAKRLLIVDSYSTDHTLTIAKSYGAEVVQHPWVNHATQFNWALENISIETAWTMRLDADEVVFPELANTLNSRLDEQFDVVAGLTVNRRIHFLGRWIRHGGVYPARMLRIWRTGKGRCENRWMDEHIKVKGEIVHLDGDIADINLNNMTWWTNKHNHYASREAIDLLQIRKAFRREESDTALNSQARFKRWIKEKIYVRFPLGIRALVYFLYRYCLRLGFLDGWQGLAFHFLQGFWYRFLVDVKVYELEATMRTQGLTLEQVVRQEFGYEL